MIFRETPIKDARVIELETRGDERGFFARMFCEREFGAAGCETRYVNINNSLSRLPGTLRGMHYQLGVDAEVKVVRCVRGALWDCIVDLRPDSPSFGKWFGETLTAENRKMLYAPRGCAHAILTLEADTETIYLNSNFYAPQSERGLRWNDPRFEISWPMQPVEISAKDASWPAFDPKHHGIEDLRGLK